MMYNRAVASDFDDWEQVHKNPGWGAKDLVPLLKKVRKYPTELQRSREPIRTCFWQTEAYQVVPGKDDVHGYSGPLKVSYGGKFTNIGQDFLEVAKKFDPAREHTEDPNQIYKSNAYGVRRLPDAWAIKA